MNTFYKFRHIILSTLVLSTLIIVLNFAFAQQKDAVGVRIMPNPKHMPVQLWYEEQDFPKGNPQPILVDGYDGIKDGRTIYVNAINVINAQIKSPFYCNLSGSAAVVSCDDSGANISTKKNNFYTNVYIISNSGLSDDTGEIFKQLTDNWHFNKNIADLSIKKGLRNDARRLADIAYLQAVLEKYRVVHGKYPTLNAGTYLEGETMSKWPSWQDNLGQDLGIQLPIDPINSFYFDKCPQDKPDCYCKGYSAQTCWNGVTKLFNGKRTITEGLSNNNNVTYEENGETKTSNLQNAMVYYYISSGNGSSYELGAYNWETLYIGKSYIADMQSAHSVGNTKPIIKSCDRADLGRKETKLAEISAYDNDKFTGKLAWELIDLIGIAGNKETICNTTMAGTKITSNDAGCCLKEVEILSDEKKADGLYNEKYISYRKIKITSNDAADSCSAKILVKAADDGIKNVADSVLESDVYNINVLVKKEAANIIGTSKNFGVIGYPFKSEIRSSSVENLVYTWSVNTSGVGCLNNLTLSDGKIGGLSLNKNVIAGTPTSAGIYCIKISVAGGNDYQAKITILNNSPRILSVAETDAVAGKLWDFDVSAHDNVRYSEIDNREYPHLPIKFKFDFDATDKPDWLQPEILGGGYIEGVKENNDIYTKTISGMPNIIGTVPKIFTYKFTIIAEDGMGAKAIQPFTLNIINHAPVITKWPKNIVKRDNESFAIKIEAVDEDKQPLFYALEINPKPLQGVLLKINTDGSITPAGGRLVASDAGVYDVTVKVSDGYGGQDYKTFSLKINTYCGDAILQKPNMEGVGGINNDGNESCDTDDGVGKKPAESSKEKQYECSDKCTPAGGWCGNGILQNGKNGTKDFGEKCEGTQGIAVKPEESSIDRQYGCTGLCSPVGGYCGDGIINGGEICDGNTRACSGKFAEGLPAHCASALFQGTQACDNTCTGWEEKCVIPPPTIETHSSTACGSTSPEMNDYACCELTGCSQDGCACCGRGEAAVKNGYVRKQSMSVSWNTSQKLDAGYLNSDGTNKYTSCGDLSNAGNSPSNACKLSWKDVNQRAWKITTEHSTASYRCWK